MNLEEAKFTLPRVTATFQPGTGACRVGVGTARILVGTGYGYAGYSKIGQTCTATGSVDPARNPHASALVVEDTYGRRFALVFADLWTGSRLVTARVARRLATRGLGTGDILLVGTHTHTGPGHYVGDSLFDVLAQNDKGLEPKIVSAIVRAVATALHAACDDLAPGAIGVATGALWDVACNRSLPAFQANPEAATWHALGAAAPPPGLAPESLAIDPRVRTIVAVQGATVRGVFATFGCHATSLGKDHTAEDADWPGRARVRVRERLSLADDVVIALAASAAGDITPMRPDRLGDMGSLNEARCAEVGTAVGDTVAALVPTAKAAAAPVAFQVYSGEWVPAVAIGGEAKLPAWAYGLPALGGSEEGRTAAASLPLCKEGNPGPNQGPHGAKRKTADLAELALGVEMKQVNPGERLPVHLVHLGQLTLVAVPGEPTVTTARRLAAAVGAPDALVLHCAGAYAGYFTTPEEYALQHYEGASTTFGPRTVPHLAATLRALPTGGAAPAPQLAFATWLRDGATLDLALWDAEDRGVASPLLTDLPAPIGAVASPVAGGVLVSWIAADWEPGALAPEIALLDVDGERLPLPSAPAFQLDAVPGVGQRRTAVLPLDGPAPAASVVVGPTRAHAGFVVRITSHPGAAANSPQAAFAAAPGALADTAEPVDGVSLALAAAQAPPAVVLAAAAATSSYDLWVASETAKLAAARAAGFTFPCDTPAIPLDPTNRSFEPGDPAWWPTAIPALAQKAAPTQAHQQRMPASDNAWRYPLPPRADGSSRVAILGDFGTGLYYSRYIALQAARIGVDAVFHLGDVYAAGRDREVEVGLRAPLADAGLLGHVPVYALPGNHELYSQGGPQNAWGGAYLEFLAASRKAFPGVQTQENSSFVVDVGAHRLVGVDTDWGRNARLDDNELRHWLVAAVQEGRAAGRTVVLLTQNQPYDLDKSGTRALRKDLDKAVGGGLVDLWLWGNVHYAALYERTKDHPFWGGCAGHAGHPHARLRPSNGWGAPVPVRWVEHAPRFPEWTDVRQDQLANGFVTLDLHADGAVTVSYLDWMGNVRVDLRLDRQADGALHATSFHQHAVPGKP